MGPEDPLQLRRELDIELIPVGVRERLQQIVNGADAWALAITLLGTFIGAAVWAIASHGNNHHYAGRGRMAALTSAGAALVIGAAPGLVNFFQHLGTTAK